MVRKKIKTKFLVGVVLGFFWTASPVFAFFVGNIEINSKFGENFEASFEIHLDKNSGYEVALGDVNDYEKLRLVRPSLVDSLALEKPAASSGTKKVIRVFSEIPLFFPSFNLVVIAKHNGGTLLENFLVTVDFKKGLVLNAQGKKKKNPPVPSVKPSFTQKEIPIEEKKVSPLDQGKDFSEQEVENLPQNVEDISSVKTLAINPTPVVNRLQNRRRLSGAIWAVPKKVFPIVVSKDSLTPSSKNKPEKREDTAVSSSGDIIQVKRGEGLFSVARKINVKDIHPSRIAVALWMKNIDKFIYGNIHGIQSGTLLDKTGLEKLVAKIDLQTAKNILNNQVHEWKIAREKVNEVEEVKPDIHEVPLPVERIDQVSSIFDWIEGWKSSWEKNDIGRHIFFYNENLVENPEQSPFLGRKKNLFLKHPNPSLNLSSPNLISKHGGTWVIFEQHFLSKSLESFGTKEVRLKWVNGNWKIDEEKFYAEKNEITESIHREKAELPNSLPFVIHVSSHSKEAEAYSFSNKLRENGYDAYTAPVRISKGVKIYRVYMGRFANWNQAHRVIKGLRRKKLAGHATVIPYPFTLQIGEVNTIVQARQLLEKLRQKRISGLLSVSHSESAKGLQFNVFVGAFKSPENAVWLMKRLKEEGFSFKQINP